MADPVPLVEFEDEPQVRDAVRLLPPRYAIALAARCAQRVQPLYKLFWSGAAEHHVRGLQTALSEIENFARGSGAVTKRTVDTVDAAVLAATPSSHVARCAAVAALHAVNAALHPDRADDRAMQAWRYSGMTARSAQTAADPRDAEGWVWSVVMANHHDLELLSKASLQVVSPERVTISREVLGPLWPDGEPEWKVPSPTRKKQRKPIEVVYSSTEVGREELAALLRPGKSEPPVLEIHIDAGEASSDEIRDLLVALSEVQRAAGGLGMQFKGNGKRAYAPVEAVR